SARRTLWHRCAPSSSCSFSSCCWPLASSVTRPRRPAETDRQADPRRVLGAQVSLRDAHGDHARGEARGGGDGMITLSRRELLRGAGALVVSFVAAPAAEIAFGQTSGVIAGKPALTPDEL